MKNKQHEYILKAFINSRIPMAIRRNSPELIAIDSVVGGVLLSIDTSSKIH